MRRLVLLLVGLSACTSPVEECVDAAQRDYEGLMAAIAISEANLQRGFAVSRDYVPSSGFTFCSGTRIGTHGFGGGLLACQSARLKTVTTPVPIDLAEEERKLASMQSRLVVARELRDRRMNACYQGVSG